MTKHFSDVDEWKTLVIKRGFIVEQLNDILFAHHPGCFFVLGTFNIKFKAGYLNETPPRECRINCNEFSKCKINRG